MMFSQKISLIFFLSVTSCSDDLTVDYYVNLIINESARAATFSVPQDSSEFRTTSEDILNYGTFDYIIVGAGSAGSVITNRLSAIEGNQVLLLEAGGFESNFSEILGMVYNLQGLEFNWNYNSTPQNGACLGIVESQCSYPRGKVLGGTSSISGSIYARGNKIDYDMWYKQGNPGWSYEEVLPYFIKSEDAHIVGDEGYHGNGGYINIEHYKPSSPQLGAFIAANLELGREYVDYNGENQLGVSLTQSSSVNGRRQSISKAYLAPVVNRPNLIIVTNSLVTKILIDPLTKTAYGVLFSNNGQYFTAQARKETIISAGVIGSPQLLMLSGIGPEDHLRSLGIPVIQPLPVGNNFHDQPAFFGLHFETSYVEPIKSLQEYVREYLHGFGQLSITGNVQGLAFLQSNLSKPPGYPDIEIIIVTSNNTSSFTQKVFHLTNETYNNVFAKMDPTRSISFYIILLHPKSRGNIRLKSSDPYDYPLIDPNFLTDPYGEDIETLYQGIQLALEIVNTNAFRTINAKLINAAVSDCQGHEYLSKDYWYCQIRQITSSIFHPVGSCKMGPYPHHGAVVNHELRVHGISNLRVADASIMPDIISGGPNAPTVMIGEKVADMIINEDKVAYIILSIKIFEFVIPCSVILYSVFIF